MNRDVHTLYAKYSPFDQHVADPDRLTHFASCELVGAAERRAELVRQRTARTWSLAAFPSLIAVIGAWLVHPLVLPVAAVAVAVSAAATYWYAAATVAASLRRLESRRISNVFLPQLYDMVCDLAERFAIPVPDCYVAGNDQPNAFAASAGGRRPVIVIHAGLLTSLRHDEVFAVLAHEMAHIANRDVLRRTIAIVRSGEVTRWTRRKQNNSGMLLFSAVALGALSRTCERLADLDAAVALNSATPLLAALDRLAGLPSFTEMSPTQARMVRLLSTHPGDATRLAELRSVGAVAVSQLRELVDDVIVLSGRTTRGGRCRNNGRVGEGWAVT